MILLLPTPEQIDNAQRRERELTDFVKSRSGKGHLNNSILSGKGTLAGMVGEEMSKSIYTGWEPSAGDALFHYDLLDLLHLGRVEVKTKQCTSEPRPDYNCSVAASNIKQQCDYYLFVRTLMDFSKVWILGFMPKEQFYRDSYFGKRGTIDPASNQNWRFRWDCYNMPISQLIPPPETPEGLALFQHRPAASPNFDPMADITRSPVAL